MVVPSIITVSCIQEPENGQSNDACRERDNGKSKTESVDLAWSNPDFCRAFAKRTDDLSMGYDFRVSPKDSSQAADGKTNPSDLDEINSVRIAANHRISERHGNAKKPHRNVYDFITELIHRLMSRVFLLLNRGAHKNVMPTNYCYTAGYARAYARLYSQSPLLAWLHGSRPPNFYQGLSPEQKSENSAFTGAIHYQPPVFG